MAAHASINLLPKSEFERSFWGKFLKWSLSAGRYAIILTELVVIVAFLSRFKLDQDLLDINDRIEGQKAILEATAHTEATFRSTQNRLNQASQLLDGETLISATLEDVVSLMPSGMGLSQLTITSETISLTAATPSEQTLGQFISQARNSQKWQAVSITSIAASANQGVTAAISITR